MYSFSFSVGDSKLRSVPAVCQLTRSACGLSVIRRCLRPRDCAKAERAARAVFWGQPRLLGQMARFGERVPSAEICECSNNGLPPSIWRMPSRSTALGVPLNIVSIRCICHVHTRYGYICQTGTLPYICQTGTLPYICQIGTLPYICQIGMAMCRSDFATYTVIYTPMQHLILTVTVYIYIFMCRFSSVWPMSASIRCCIDLCIYYY